MNDELKTCPFCGGESEVVDIYGACLVRCTVCSVYQEFETSKEEAVQLWNRRAEDARIKELESENAALKKRLVDQNVSLAKQAIELERIGMENVNLEIRLECPKLTWNGHLAFVSNRLIGDVSRRGSYWRVSCLTQVYPPRLSESEAQSTVESAWREHWNKIHGVEVKK